MKPFRQNTFWLLTAVSLTSLGVGATFFGQNSAAGRQLTLEVPPPRTNSLAKDLSSSFRSVAKLAMPAVVSIETRTKGRVASEEVADDSFPEGNSQLEELFKDNPQFREFFRRRGAPREMPRQRGMGSGFIVDAGGVIITNNHVIANADQVRVRLQDGTEYLATEWKSDPRTDVAVVRIKPNGPLPVLKLGDSDQCEVGDWVLAVGSPFGLDFTVTQGIISAKGRGQGILEREDFLQTDAAVNPGNSGGPLLNLDGEVVGINTAISSRSGGNDGVAFAVPVNIARWVTQQLTTHGAVQRGYLGVAIQPVSNELARLFNIPVGQGAIVGQIVPSSPAAEAKLETGDVILTLDNKKVRDPRNLQGIVEQLEIGKSYPLEIMRDGKKSSVNITIREMPKNFTVANSEAGEAAEDSKVQEKSGENKDLGITVQGINSGIAGQLGYKGEVKGVVVSDVAEGSAAEEAGIRSGMVIEKVGSKRIATVDEFMSAMKDTDVSKGVLLLIRTPSGSRFVVINKD